MSKLEALAARVNKDYKSNVMTWGIPEKQCEKIPFSSPTLNYMTYGGLPRGRLIEFFGEEGGGKTTTTLDIVKNAQILFEDEYKKTLKVLKDKTKGKPKKADLDTLEAHKRAKAQTVLYLDCENTLDLSWSKKLGVDVDKMMLVSPDNQAAEEIFEIALQAIETGEVGLVVIDSLGVMLSEQAFEKQVGEKTYAGISQALTNFSKKAVMLCARYNTMLIGINQMRDNLNSQFGGTVTTGGKAWKHNCTVRMEFRKDTFLDTKGEPINRGSKTPAGNSVMVRLEKSKVSPPDRRLITYTLMYETGIDVEKDYVDLGIQVGTIQQSGSWYSFIDISTGEILTEKDGDTIQIQGKAGTVELIKQRKDVFDWLREQLKNV
jgi:RecA/RadA recombinase